MPKKRKIDPPSQQPGGEVLTDIGHVYMRWVHNDIYSDEAIEQIGGIVAQNEFFEGLLESAGWGQSIHCKECGRQLNSVAEVGVVTPSDNFYLCNECSEK